MNQENEREREMRPEYDIRGGVRGKYGSRYNDAARVTTVTGKTFSSTLILNTSSTAQVVAVITRPASYPSFQASPKIQLGSQIAVTADSG